MYIHFNIHKMSKSDKYFFKSSHNVPVRKTDVILYDVAAKNVSIWRYVGMYQHCAERQ